MARGGNEMANARCILCASTRVTKVSALSMMMNAISLKRSLLEDCQIIIN